MANPGVLLELRGVSKEYDAPDGRRLRVLDDVSLELQRGEALAITGPSGSGKSTLLHIMGSLDRPDQGQVLLNGTDLARMSEPDLARVRNRSIGFVFQSHFLLPHCTVLENTLLPTLARQGPADRGDTRAETPERRATELLGRLGLAERTGHRPGQLSGGERQRVAVARALINRPEIVLADEPTGALDQASAGELGRLLRELNREHHVTLVVVTHSLELAQLIGNVRSLRAGRLLPRETEREAAS